MPDYTYDEQIFSDLYKDCYGFRCRSHEFYDAEPARKQEIWDYLIQELDEEVAREKAMKAQAIEDFETLVAKTMLDNTIDRVDAVRWLMDAELDDFMDDDYFKYTYNLPYNYNLIGAQAA